MAHVDMQAVIHDTLVPRPEVQRYWKPLVAVVAALMILAAFTLPGPMLIAAVLAYVLAMLIRFAYCYVTARNATYT